MGRKEDAIREGRRAVELKPESKDAVDGAIMNCYLALIYARVGENDLAIPLIERLLKTPGTVDSVDYSITVNDLKPPECAGITLTAIVTGSGSVWTNSGA